MAPNPPQMACPERQSSWLRAVAKAATRSRRRRDFSSRRRRWTRNGPARSRAIIGPRDRCLDMVFRDDECRMRMQNAPVNFANIKHIASNLLRKAPGTACGWPGKARRIQSASEANAASARRRAKSWSTIGAGQVSPSLTPADASMDGGAAQGLWMCEAGRRASSGQ